MRTPFRLLYCDIYFWSYPCGSQVDLWDDSILPQTYFNLTYSSQAWSRTLSCTYMASVPLLPMRLDDLAEVVLPLCVWSVMQMIGQARRDSYIKTGDTSSFANSPHIVFNMPAARHVMTSSLLFIASGLPASAFNMMLNTNVCPTSTCLLFISDKLLT